MKYQLYINMGIGIIFVLIGFCQLYSFLTNLRISRKAKKQFKEMEEMLNKPYDSGKIIISRPNNKENLQEVFDLLQCLPSETQVKIILEKTKGKSHDEK